MPAQTSGFAAELYKVYQDGKIRRYNLLFAVNGGAFAILKFSVGPGGSSSSPEVLLPLLPWGMVIFSLAMFTDIWSFGRAMSKSPELEGTAFTPIGMIILSIITALLVTGWVLLALGKGVSAGVALIVFFAAAIALPGAGELIRRMAGHLVKQ
jgi:hypothetical protein